MIIWPIATIPATGVWLECNGQSATAYPLLTAIIGPTVPDYRGYFLRGYGGNSDAIGIAQGDAIRNITGYTGASLPNSPGCMTGAFARAGTGGVGWYADVAGGTSFDASRVVPTANENRPVNKAVRYLIRAA